MNTDDAYESLADVHDGDQRWAFGTGFDDPLHGVDRTVPAGVDAGALAEQCLALGDEALVLSQRLAAWTSNAPELEDELALANIALDLLGQARLLLSRAATLDRSVRPDAAPGHVPDEDALAYFRPAADFRCSALAVFDDDGDFARAVVRLWAAATIRATRLAEAGTSPDPVLAAVAVKGGIEGRYHLEYATGWLIRLGDGTEYSRQRMQAALDVVWPYLGSGVDDVEAAAGPVLAAATLVRPPRSPLDPGPTVEAELEALLAELQSVARAHPDATW